MLCLEFESPPPPTAGVPSDDVIEAGGGVRPTQDGVRADGQRELCLRQRHLLRLDITT